MTLTENLIDGSGSNTYNFTFPILDQEDVKVQLREFDPNLPPEDQIVSQISTTAFDVFSSPNRVVFQPIANETIYQDANGNVKVTSDNGYQVVIRIYRDTDIDGTAAYFYPGSAIRAEDLNDNFRQLIFAAQETDAELEDILAGIFPDDSIPGTALKDGAVTTVKIADGAVTTDKIADDAVTPDKLDRVYVEPGDNVSDLVNDANYVSVGDNVSDLVNDANYVSVGDNVSDLVNDLNYLEPGDNVSELTNDVGYITAAQVPPTGVTQLVAGNNVTISPTSGTGVVTVNSTGGGGGGTGTPTNTNILGTAKAAGWVSAAGAKLSGFGFTSALAGQGNYQITFDTPRSDANYFVTGLSHWNPSGFETNLNVGSKSSTGFTVIFFQENVDNSSTPGTFDFAVHDEEPAEIALTTTGDVINYSGASAWASVSSTGVLENGLNVASTSRSSLGTYEVTFSTPMPNDTYSVTIGGATSLVGVINKTANGFTVVTFSDLTTKDDREFSFTVFAINALPPKGGTGSDAWCATDADGTVRGSYNIASVTKTTTGTYAYVFTTPMPTADYAIVGTSNSGLTCGFDNRTSTGFTLTVRDTANTLLDRNHNVVVHGTNATLPLTYTTEQIDSAINNPGCSAWASVAPDGTIENGLNIASVTENSPGYYTATFKTPMPDANYSISGLAEYTSGAAAVWLYVDASTKPKTVNEFSYYITNQSGVTSNQNHSLQVFSTNALPPTGGTGTDAWFVAPGALNNVAITPLSSFNIASISRSGAGQYNVLFTTPMPTENYSAIAGINEPGALGNNYSIRVRNRNQNGFTVQAFEGDGPSAVGVDPNQFSVVVNATNATLPATLTQDMIVLKTGDTMTGELIVPSLSSPSGNLPIQRASVADSQVQTFEVQDNTASNWYPFNPIPTWCNHVRYNISTVLSNNNVGNGGLYLRWGHAGGSLLQDQVSNAGSSTSILQNGPGTVLYVDPLLLPASPSEIYYYDYVMDYYIYNRGIGGGDDFFCFGIGSGAVLGSATITATVSHSRMLVQHIRPISPNTIQADRMGILFFGGDILPGQNIAQVKQTFMTDGPVGFPADLGPTPTPIP